MYMWRGKIELLTALLNKQQGSHAWEPDKLRNTQQAMRQQRKRVRQDVPGSGRLSATRLLGLWEIALTRDAGLRVDTEHLGALVWPTKHLQYGEKEAAWFIPAAWACIPLPNCNAILPILWNACWLEQSCSILSHHLIHAFISLKRADDSYNS